ncbi:MAG: SulP family inorganic anion transporter, partial [Verrucomicrobiota bacterium]
MGKANTIGRLGRKIADRNHLKFFPLREVLPTYTQRAAQRDLQAGVSVALLAFPQGMAFAAIAGLPIAYGIFGSAIAAIIAPIWSGSRYIVAGPTNA